MKSNVPRSLATSKYNDRVDECTRGLNILKKEYKIDNLCQLNISDLPHIQELIVDPTLYKRIRHVINEKNRVDLFIKALKEKDITSLGRILCESHQSLKNDYEVTGEYLDTITDSAMENGAFGARMTGAGFGGCAIALIKRKDFDSFKKKVEEKYYLRTNIKGECFLIDIVDGPRKEI